MVVVAVVVAMEVDVVEAIALLVAAEGRVEGGGRRAGGAGISVRSLKCLDKMQCTLSI